MSTTPPLTPRSKRAFSIAGRLADESGHSYLGTEHLLIGVMESEGGTVETFLREAGISRKELFQTLLSRFRELYPPTAPKEDRTERMMRILQKAVEDIEKLRSQDQGAPLAVTPTCESMPAS